MLRKKFSPIALLNVANRRSSLIAQLRKNVITHLSSMYAVLFSFAVPTRWLFSLFSTASAHFRHRVAARNTHEINHIKLATVALSGLKFHHDNWESRYAYHITLGACVVTLRARSVSRRTDDVSASDAHRRRRRFARRVGVFLDVRLTTQTVARWEWH